MGALKYTPKQVAEWFLCNIDRAAGDVLTHLKLQKLVYYSQAWALALYDRPLFEEEIEAWSHGPVVPSLFQEYKIFGWDSLPTVEECADFDDETEELLVEILDIYGQHSAKHLEILTHRERPWQLARGNLSPEERSNAIITKQSMAEFYKTLLD